MEPPTAIPPFPPPPPPPHPRHIKDEAAQTPKHAIFPSLPGDEVGGRGRTNFLSILSKIVDSVDTEERKSQPRFQGLLVH